MIGASTVSKTEISQQLTSTENQFLKDDFTQAAEIAKSAAEKHVRFFHSDDPAVGEAETEAERLEHDAVIDRFVHLTNSKGLPHNEELHRMVHHGPAANIAGGDIENDFPVPDNVAFKKFAPGGPDVRTNNTEAQKIKFNH